MRIIVLRHATRHRDADLTRDEYLEIRLTLNEVGQNEAEKRASDIRGRKYKPAVYFTSYFEHAKRTGEILRDHVGRNPPAEVIPLCTLTPHFQGPRGRRGNWHGSQMLESVVIESELTVNGLGQIEDMVYILHRPRLAQLLAAMTSQPETRYQDIEYSGGVCLTVDSLESLLRGQAKEDDPWLRR